MKLDTRTLNTLLALVLIGFNLGIAIIIWRFYVTNVYAMMIFVLAVIFILMDLVYISTISKKKDKIKAKELKLWR